MADPEGTSYAGTDAAAQTADEPHPGGTADIGTAGQRAQSGAAELERERDAPSTQGGGAAGEGGGAAGEGDAGPAGTPDYGRSGHEGLGAEGTTSGRSHDPKDATGEV
jgi:hypothetical protein